eukprot:365157-Chlamydomonas_euryale.AAC.23
MGGWCTLLALALLLASLAPSAHALYQDLAGTFDWHLANVGPITCGGLHGSKPRAFVGSTQDVVASLQLRDGSIAWRRVLPEKLDDVVVLEDPALVLSVSGSGSRVRAWDQGDAGMRWEAFIGGPANAVAVASSGDATEAKLAVGKSSSVQVGKDRP